MSERRRAKLDGGSSELSAAEGGTTSGRRPMNDACPGCDAPIDNDRVREQGDVERFSCLSCGLQLVRRPGQQWESIRG